MAPPNTDPQIVTDTRDDVGHAAELDTTHVYPKDASRDSYSGNGLAGGHGNAEYVEPHSEVLEEEAQSKGKWFSYLKTKQFWLVMALGQGMKLS
jgi:solute carrier family 35 protein F1/2